MYMYVKYRIYDGMRWLNEYTTIQVLVPQDLRSRSNVRSMTSVRKSDPRSDPGAPHEKREAAAHLARQGCINLTRCAPLADPGVVPQPPPARAPRVSRSCQ